MLWKLLITMKNTTDKIIPSMKMHFDQTRGLKEHHKTSHSYSDIIFDLRVLTVFELAILRINVVISSALTSMHNKDHRSIVLHLSPDFVMLVHSCDLL